MKSLKFIKMPIMVIASLFIVSQSQAQEVCLQNAWEAYNKGDYTNAIKYADQCIEAFGEAALKMQKELDEKGKKCPPTGQVSEEEKAKILQTGLLNDVATACFVKGSSAEKLFRKSKRKKKKQYKRMANDAYKLAKQYECGRCWDPKGWFWSPADEAKRMMPVK